MTFSKTLKKNLDVKLLRTNLIHFINPIIIHYNNFCSCYSIVKYLYLPQKWSFKTI